MKKYSGEMQKYTFGVVLVMVIFVELHLCARCGVITNEVSASGPWPLNHRMV